MSVFSSGAYTVTQPNGLLAGENPIIIQLQTHTNSSAAYSSTKFIISDLLHDGFSISFNTNFGYQKTFYSKGYIVKDSYFLAGFITDALGNPIVATTESEIACSLAEALQRDLVLSNNYYINYSSHTVTLNAKSPSAIYDLDGFTTTIKNEHGTTVSTGITRTTLTTGNAPFEGGIVDDYNLYVEVYESGKEYGAPLVQGDFNRVTELQLPFSQDNIHKFDISNICKSFLHTPKPNFALTTATYNVDYIKYFYVRYGESYPLIAGNNSSTRKKEKGVTDFKLVMNAGLDFTLPNVMNVYSGATSYPDITGVKFLTNSPSLKKSRREGRELLYILIGKDIHTDIKLYYDLLFWDGTTSTNNLRLDLGTFTSNYGGAWIIPTGFLALGLDSVESGTGKKIKKVDVYLRSNSNTTAYSEIKSYKYDYQEPTSRYGVAFLNKLGTYDTFDFFGLVTNDINRTSNTYLLPININTDGSVVEGSKNSGAFDTKLNKKITVNSGLISESEFNWLIELLSSNEIYSYDDADKYLTVDSFKYATTNQTNEYNIEVTFIESLPQNNVNI